jgi:hypothetical protein
LPEPSTASKSPRSPSKFLLPSSHCVATLTLGRFTSLTAGTASTRTSTTMRTSHTPSATRRTARPTTPMSFRVSSWRVSTAQQRESPCHAHTNRVQTTTHPRGSSVTSTSGTQAALSCESSGRSIAQYLFLYCTRNGTVPLRHCEIRLVPVLTGQGQRRRLRSFPPRGLAQR